MPDQGWSQRETLGSSRGKMKAQRRILSSKDLTDFVKGVQPERSQPGWAVAGEQLGTGVDNLIPMRTGAVCGTAKGRRVDSAEALFFS